MPHPPHRIPRIPHIPRPPQPLALIQNGIHVPRAQTIDPNPIAAPLGCERLGERQQRRLGRVIRRLGLGIVCVVGGDGRGEDDAAGRLLPHHLPRDALRAEEAAREVDVVRAPPLGRAHVDGVRAPHHAGEAAQHVDAAQHRHAAFHRRRYLRLFAHVDGFGDDAPVREARVQLFDRFVCLVWVHVPEREPRGAVLEEGAGGFESERSGASCYCFLLASAFAEGRRREHAGNVPLNQTDHVLIALPLTWNLYCALSVAVRLSGGGLGAVNGFSAVDRTISGSWRFTREARSSGLSGIVGGGKHVRWDKDNTVRSIDSYPKGSVWKH